MPNQTLIRARPRQPRPAAMQGTGDLNSDAWYEILGIERPTRSLAVTDATVRGLPAGWSAVNKIANAVAQMLTAADVLAGDGRTPMTVPSVVEQPDVGLDAFPFWKMAVSTALMRGNFIGIKADWSPAGYPNQVIAAPMDAVNAYYDVDGYPVYEIGGTDYTPDQIVHVRTGVPVPGQIMAIGPVEACRRSLSGMLDQQGMANSVFKEGAVPSAVVQLQIDNPTATQAATVKGNWVDNVGGRRTVAVIGKNQTYTPISWSADDAQFIEGQQLSVAMMALIFGLQPSDLDATIGGGGMTYGNRQDDALQRIVDAYTPVMMPFEQAWSRLLPGRSFVRGNPEALLRSTTEQRYTLHKLAQEIQLETPDETRDLEGKPRLPKTEIPPPPAPPTTDEENPDDVVPE